jgi:bifunctional UDP-N-acetylglucosamine pyrophosphorylase/glucosamine-1-phosphate N-acetyltransferase
LPLRVAAVILAAGAGTRMQSALSKPLHTLAGRPMIDYVIDAAEIPQVEKIVVVLSPDLNANDELLAHLQRRLGGRLGVAMQQEQRGTGDALRCALPLVQDADSLIVLFADHPLLTPERVDALSGSLAGEAHVVGLLTCTVADPGGYGRVIRSPAGEIERIVERKDDDLSARTRPAEINSGMMALSAAWLASVANQLMPSDTTGELYLTQLVELARAEGYTVANVLGDESELIGVNDQHDLAVAEGLLLHRIRRRLAAAGVRFTAPETSVVEFGVEIGPDTTILPGCLLRAGTVIGRNCEIGPHSVLTAARIGDACVIRSSYVSNSEIRAGSDVGPFSHVRDGTVVDSNVHVGNFAEIKNSRLDEAVRMGHFGYVGDATVGARTNLGAGAVTCNFDGKDKHRTQIGADAFIGSDTMLVAPLSVGDGAVTGAGSVVTKDVPARGRVAGVPAKAIPGAKREGGNDG